ncbi:hypothetical protein JCM3766R1_006769 [Sporobolomyces carnicolor]
MPFRRHSSDKGHSEHLPERHDDHHDHHDQHEPHDKPRSRFSRFSFRSRSKSPHHGDQDSHAIHGPSLKRVDSAHSHHPHHSPRSPSPTSSLASNHEHGHGEGGHDEIGARSEELSKAVKHLLLDVFDHWSKERGTTAKEVQDHLVEWDDKFYKEVDLFSLSDSKFEDLLRKLGAVNVDHFFEHESHGLKIAKHYQPATLLDSLHLEHDESHAHHLFHGEEEEDHLDPHAASHAYAEHEHEQIRDALHKHLDNKDRHSHHGEPRTRKYGASSGLFRRHSSEHHPHDEDHTSKPASRRSRVSSLFRRNSHHSSTHASSTHRDDIGHHDQHHSTEHHDAEHHGASHTPREKKGIHHHVQRLFSRRSKTHSLSHGDVRIGYRQAALHGISTYGPSRRDGGLSLVSSRSS